MSNEILYILLPDYAAHEAVYLSQAIASDEFALKENPKYVNKVVATTLEPVKSIGGFRTLPDYSFETIPDTLPLSTVILSFHGYIPRCSHSTPPGYSSGPLNFPAHRPLHFLPARRNSYSEFLRHLPWLSDSKDCHIY